MGLGGGGQAYVWLQHVVMNFTLPTSLFVKTFSAVLITGATQDAALLFTAVSMATENLWKCNSCMDLGTTRSQCL